MAVAEEHDDISIEQVPASVERQGRVGTEVDTIPDRGRKRQIDAGPGASAIRRRVAAHRQPEDFVRASSDGVRVVGVQGDEGFALRSAFIRNVNGRSGGGRESWWSRFCDRAILEQILILRPPTWVERRVVLS